MPIPVLQPVSEPLDTGHEGSEDVSSHLRTATLQFGDSAQASRSTCFPATTRPEERSHEPT